MANTHSTAASGSPSAAATTAAPLSTVATAQQAVAAIGQSAIDASLAADKERDAAEARKTAAAARKTADAKAARIAAAKAASVRAAAQAASRAAQRAVLNAAPAASSSPSPSASPAAPAPTAGTTIAPASTGRAAQLIAFLQAQLGKPYVYGATGPGSYDCSGLTQAAFSSVGVSLPRTSQEQSNAGTPVSLSALQPGDLIFWGGQGSAYHVGVYVGGGQYLDAANPSTPVGIHQLADYMPDWAVRVL